MNNLNFKLNTTVRILCRRLIEVLDSNFQLFPVFVVLLKRYEGDHHE
jgi:hypothetical protein